MNANKSKMKLLIAILILIFNINCTNVVMVSDLDFLDIYGIKESQVVKTETVTSLTGGTLYKVYYKNRQDFVDWLKSLAEKEEY